MSPEDFSNVSSRETLDYLAGLISKLANRENPDLTAEYIYAVSEIAPTMVVARSGEILYATRGFEKIFSYPPGALKGRQYTILLPDDLVERHDAYFEGFWRDPKPAGVCGSPLCLRGKDANGKALSVAVGMVPRTFPSGQAVVVTVLADQTSA